MVSFLPLITGVPAVRAQESEVWVATTGIDTNPGTQELPFATIQKGIDMVAEFGTVNAAAGTYICTNTIKIEKSLTIKSVEGAENTIIDCTTLGGNYIVSINHSNVIFDGFTVTRFLPPFGKGIIRVKGQSDGLTKNVSILNNVIIGISGIDLEKNFISGVTISGNTIENCKWGIRVKAIAAVNINIENNNILKTIWPARGVRNNATATVNATRNWWGTTNKSEVATMSSGDVVVVPYLDAPYPEGVAMSGEGDGPAQPELTKPVEDQPYFVWTDVNVDNYRLLVDDDSNFSSPCENRILVVNYYQTPLENALEDGVYYWKVIAYNSEGETASDAWSFAVGEVSEEVTQPILIHSSSGGLVIVGVLFVIGVILILLYFMRKRGGE